MPRHPDGARDAAGNSQVQKAADSQTIHKGSGHDAEIVVGMICRVYSWLA